MKFCGAADSEHSLMISGIDVHTHSVPEKFPPYIGSGSAVSWPSMRHAGCEHGHVMIAGMVAAQPGRFPGLGAVLHQDCR